MFSFIRREKIYILMLFFILAVNLLNTGQVKKEAYSEKKLKAISNASFEEIGITEQKVKDFLESEKFTARLFRVIVTGGFFVFVGVMLLTLGFIFRKKRLYIAPFPYKDRAPIAWGISDLIRVSIIIVFTGYIIGIVEGFIFRLFSANIDLNLRMLLNTFIIDVAVGVVVFYFVLIKYRERLQALGLRFTHFLRNILSGLGSYIFILPVLVVVLVVSIWVLSFLGYPSPPQPVFEVFMEEKSSGVLFSLIIFVAVFGPIIEEIFFRGFMYTAMRKSLGSLSAAVVSACIFSLLHTNMVGFLPIMILGMVLAYLYETTGSLVAPITVHILHNSIVLGFVFFIREFVG